jgi:hypothetical protein
MKFAFLTMVKIYFLAFWFMTLCMLTIAVNWLVLLLCIQQLFGSHPGPDSSYPAVVFHGSFCTSSDKCCDSTTDQAGMTKHVAN